MSNAETHWDQPLRYLPVELHVTAGPTLRLAAHHDLHDIDHLWVSAVTKEMLGLGHRHLIGSSVGERLGVTIQMG